MVMAIVVHVKYAYVISPFKILHGTRFDDSSYVMDLRDNDVPHDTALFLWYEHNYKPRLEYKCIAYLNVRKT